MIQRPHGSLGNEVPGTRMAYVLGLDHYNPEVFAQYYQELDRYLTVSTQTADLDQSVITAQAQRMIATRYNQSPFLKRPVIVEGNDHLIYAVAGDKLDKPLAISGRIRGVLAHFVLLQARSEDRKFYGLAACTHARNSNTSMVLLTPLDQGSVTPLYPELN